jgi:N-acetylmuramoyl-L-alanine amidase
MASTSIARSLRIFSVILVVSGLFLFSSPSQSPGGSPAEEKRVSIYSVVANYSVAVVERNGRDYVGLLEALDPLGTVKATAVGDHWKLRYDRAESEFTSGSSHARVRRRDFDLRDAFLLENGRGLVPLSSLGPLLSELLGGPVTFHEASRRVFIGSSAIHFTAQISRQDPPTLVMTFTSPVNPMIATEPGKLHMIFHHEAVVAPGSPALTFGDKTIPSASYEETNGAAEITVNGTAPLFASFSNGNHTITISASPAAVVQATSPAQPTPAASPAPSVSATLSPLPPQFFAVVDASHGGDERGEAISEQLAEKDVTLAFARSLRQELEARGMHTLVLRDGSATLTLEQRATLTNVAHPELYICVHASSQGRGVRLYTAMLPPDGVNRGPFLDWDTAQASFLPLSKLTATGIASSLQQRQIPVRVLLAPLRPLNSIAAAAVAVEIAPSTDSVSSLSSATYQQQVNSALAAGVLSLRSQLEAGR